MDNLKPETPSWYVLPEKSEVTVEFTQEVQAVPYSREEVENEVLDAVKEAKVLDAVNEDKVLDSLKEEFGYKAKDEVPNLFHEGFLINTDRLNDYVDKLKQLNESNKRVRTKRTVGEQRALINNLRRQDDVHNRTCASCSRRLPIQRFARLKKSEICLDCEEG